MSNPVNFSIDLGGASGNAAGHITCTTNAGYTQQAVITITDATSRVVAIGTFQGKGEGNTKISLTTGGTVLSFSNAVLPLTFNGQFNYDPNGSFVPNEPNKVILTTLYDDKQTELFTITSEDSVDGDFNDLILTCVTINH